MSETPKCSREAKEYDVFPRAPRFDPKLRMTGEPPTNWAHFGNNVWLPEPTRPS